MAAATGSGTSRGWPSPAATAASDSTSRRVAPQAAGHVMVTCGTALPIVRRSSSTTRASTADSSCTTGTSRSPNSTAVSSMRRFGLGSNRAGSSRACRSASRPTASVPSSARNTEEGTSGEPSIASNRGAPPSTASAATVFEVPKSTASTRILALPLPSGGPGASCHAPCRGGRSEPRRPL